MNVLFINPDSQAYYRDFVRGLREIGARVIGLGHAPRSRLPPALKPFLDDRVGHEFIAHYYPGCLAATVDRTVSPQIAVTNRIEKNGCRELREIGARPAGERIWDMYRVANDFDVYREWASALVHGRTEGELSRAVPRLRAYRAKASDARGAAGPGRAGQGHGPRADPLP